MMLSISMKFFDTENYQPVRRQTHYRNYSDFSKIKNNPIKYRSESYHRWERDVVNLYIK